MNFILKSGSKLIEFDLIRNVDFDRGQNDPELVIRC